MASTGFNDGPDGGTTHNRHNVFSEKEYIAGKEGGAPAPKETGVDKERAVRYSSTTSIAPALDYTHRRLKPRHIQLIGIGGTIGTALFVAIGQGLINGGPGSLFIAFTLWYVYNASVLVASSRRPRRLSNSIHGAAEMPGTWVKIALYRILRLVTPCLSKPLLTYRFSYIIKL